MGDRGQVSCWNYSSWCSLDFTIFHMIFVFLLFRCELLNERPYLSEAGPVVFDALYDAVIRQVSYIVKSPSLSHNVVSLDTLIRDSIYVLMGVPSRTYNLDKVQCIEPAICKKCELYDFPPVTKFISSDQRLISPYNFSTSVHHL